MEEMEERVSGFEVRGSWTDVVELGERVTEALSEAGVSGEAFEEWEEWRPKADERIDEEMSEKTSEQASVDEGAGERADVSAGRDLKTAGERFGEASEELQNDGSDDALDSIRDSVDHAKRAVDTTGRQALRSVEDAVYRNVMTRIAPYYFDNDLITANLRETGRFDDEEEFAFEVGIDDDDLEDEVSDRLDEYEATVDRWHIDTPKDTSTVEATKDAERAE